MIITNGKKTVTPTKIRTRVESSLYDQKKARVTIDFLTNRPGENPPFTISGDREYVRRVLECIVVKLK